MALPANVGTGTVIGHYIDSNGNAINGNVTFTPSVKKLLNISATPPTTIIPKKVTVPITEGSFSVTLIATDDTDNNPVGWTYNVSIVPSGADAEKLDPFDIEVPEGGTVDLTIVAPVAKSNGVIITRGVGIPDPTGAENGYVITWDDPEGEAVWAAPTGGSGGGDVASVNGKVGIVTLDATDVGALPSTYVPLWVDISGKPSQFTPSSHTHVATEIADSTTIGRGLLTAEDQAAQHTILGLGDAATANIGTGTNTVAAGDDPRFGRNSVEIRQYVSGTGWPERGSVPEGWRVWWVNDVNDTLPAAGGTGYLPGDIVLLNVGGA